MDDGLPLVGGAPSDPSWYTPCPDGDAKYSVFLKMRTWDASKDENRSVKLDPLPAVYAMPVASAAYAGPDDPLTSRAP